MAQKRPSLRLPHRRGSMYAMVLGVTMLITVIGIGALATSRVTTRATGVSNDWVESGDAAFSGVEHALAKINAAAAASPTTWRDAYTSGSVAFSGNFGRSQLKWVLTDEDDGILNNDYGQMLRLYGIGKIGATKRVYSVQLNATGDALDVLRTAMHSSEKMALSGQVMVLGGPVSTNDKLTGNPSLKGGFGSETVKGGGTVVTAEKPMPPSSTFDLYKARATVIASSNAAGGNFQPTTLSATSNPYGATNADGIYYLRLPSTITKLNLLSSRYKGTLVIENAAGVTNQELDIAGGIYWEPNQATFPIIITRGFVKVTINGNNSSYTDSSGTYATELRGLIHIVASDVILNDAAFIRGCLIVEGKITTSGTVGLITNPALLTSPPLGYTKGNRILPIPGTWKWDAPPAGI